MPCRPEPDEYYQDNSVYLLTEITQILPNRQEHYRRWFQGGASVKQLCRLLKKLTDQEWEILNQNATPEVLNRLKRWQQEHLAHDQRRELTQHQAVISRRSFEPPSPESPRKQFPMREEVLFRNNYTPINRIWPFSEPGRLGPWAKSLFFHKKIQHAVLKIPVSGQRFEVILLIDGIIELCELTTPIEKIWPYFYYPFFDVPLGETFSEHRYQHDLIEDFFRDGQYDLPSTFERLILEAYDHQHHPLKFRRALTAMLCVLERAINNRHPIWEIGFIEEFEAVLSVNPMIRLEGQQENVSDLIRDIIDVGFSFFNETPRPNLGKRQENSETYRNQSIYSRHNRSSG